jgi:hypothetical protein
MQSFILLKVPFGSLAHVYFVSSHLYVGAGVVGGMGFSIVNPEI